MTGTQARRFPERVRGTDVERHLTTFMGFSGLPGRALTLDSEKADPPIFS